MRIELGQKRQLVELLRRLDAEPDLRAFAVIADASTRREAELERLHVLAIEALLTAGYVVDVETTFEAAARETKEEHGFDVEREQSKVIRVDTFVEAAFSKRRLSKQIEHYVYAAHVSDFDETLPRISEITEDKDPGREGGTYVERGVFRTLPQMWGRARELREAIRRQPGHGAPRNVTSTPPSAALRCWTGSNAPWSTSLAAQGVVVHSDTDTARAATARHTDRRALATATAEGQRCSPADQPARAGTATGGACPDTHAQRIAADERRAGDRRRGRRAVCGVDCRGTGASVVLVSATALAETATYWAQGGLAAALAVEDSSDRHLADTEAAGRATRPPLGCRGARPRGACDGGRPRAPRRAIRRRSAAERSRSGSRAAIRVAASAHAGGSATGRQHRAPLSALVARPGAHRGARGRRAVSGLDARRPLRTGMRARGRPRRPRSRDDPRDRRRRRAVVAHDEPAGLARHRDVDRARRGGRARRPGVPAVPSDGGDRRRRAEGFLVTEAIRGEGATLHGPDGERFVEELAPRDEVARAIAALMAQTGATSVGLDMRAVDPALLSERRRRPRRRRAWIPTRETDPGRAGRALHDGRRR